MTKLLRLLFFCVVVLAIAGAAAVGLGIWHFGRDLPDYQQLADYEPPVTTRVYAGDGRLLAEHATERRVFVPIAAIPKRVVAAFLSAEDKNFYTHRGVDPISILRAALTDLGRWGNDRRPVGASTITQQVAKNLFLWSGRSFVRKGLEAYFTVLLEACWPKQRILEVYLNVVEMGDGVYGAEAAARVHFNRRAAELTPLQGALIAGVLPSPRIRADAIDAPYMRARAALIQQRTAKTPFGEKRVCP